MSQLNSGAYRIGGRLFKSAATSVFALSALAGGMVLSGGEAQAVTTCVTFNSPNSPSINEPCVDPDWTVSGQVFSSPGENGIVDLTDLMVSPDQATIDIDFDSPGGTSGGNNGYYKYFVETSDHKIIKASLEALNESSMSADYDV